MKNMMILAALLCFLAAGPAGCRPGTGEETARAPEPAVPAETAAAEREEALTPELKAVLHTSLGEIACVLFPDQAPETVANFVALARGERAWTDPETGEEVKRPLYSGTIFHRVIPDFMIQGGDPQGDGRGGPGYRFADEIVPELRFEEPGVLAMANAGPNTNGSQFFITVAATPWLDGRHTIFGRVVSGQEVVEAISSVPRGPQDRPLEPVVLEKVVISGGGR